MNIRPLSPLNTNYDPARPWRCITPAGHECDGQVIGAYGAYPVCQAGAVAEHARRIAEDERILALADDLHVQAAIAAELAWEARVS